MPDRDAGHDNGDTKVAMQSEFRIHRGRLPHYFQEGSTYFITFRLESGSLSFKEISLVLDHIKQGDPTYYMLFCVVVMADHVHVILRPNEGIGLHRIMKGIKGVSAHKINEIRGSSGTVWQKEYHDTILRSEKMLDEKLIYMLNNPVEAGITSDGWEYPGFYYRSEL